MGLTVLKVEVGNPAKPYMDPIRTDRRYQQLLEAIGLAIAKPSRRP